VKLYKLMPQTGTYNDGGMLYLQIAKPGAASWIFRYRLRGRERHMGLGSARVVTPHYWQTSRAADHVARRVQNQRTMK
jgi:hypothetical protein